MSRLKSVREFIKRMERVRELLRDGEDDEALQFLEYSFFKLGEDLGIPKLK